VQKSNITASRCVFRGLRRSSSMPKAGGVRHGMRSCNTETCQQQDSAAHCITISKHQNTCMILPRVFIAYDYEGTFVSAVVCRRAEAPFAAPAQPGALAASRPAAQAPSKPFAAAATAAVFATSVLPERSAPSAVLGSGIAGYTSVVTRTPISPSGYSVPIQPKHMPAQQQAQQQQTSTHGTIRTYGDPQLLSSSYGQPGEYGQVATGSSSSYGASGTPASAAAAALAALAGSHSRSSSAPSAGYAQQYASKNYAAQPAPASPTSGAKGSMLMWNVKQLPPQPGSAAGQRSGADAGAFGTARLISTAPNTSSSSGRPPSQEAGSAGLAKLKQLSTARLVRRLGTPPGAAGQLDSTTDPGYFGSRPAAPAAAAGLGSTRPSNPIAGRRAAAVQPTQRQQQQQDTVQMQQVQQRHAQVQQMQHAQQQPAQQPPRHEAANLGRPTEPSLNRRTTSSSSNSSSHRGPAGAAVQDTQQTAFSSSSSSNRSVQRASSGRAQGMAGTGAFQHTAQTQLPAGAEYQEVDRQPCASCGRCFAPAALQQHTRICDKVFGQKRKVGACK
jgi:hypothetical protein